jgi:hypothetical protein
MTLVSCVLSTLPTGSCWEDFKLFLKLLSRNMADQAPVPNQAWLAQGPGVPTQSPLSSPGGGADTGMPAPTPATPSMHLQPSTPVARQAQASPAGPSLAGAERPYPALGLDSDQARAARAVHLDADPLAMVSMSDLSVLAQFLVVPASGLDPEGESGAQAACASSSVGEPEGRRVPGSLSFGGHRDGWHGIADSQGGPQGPGPWPHAGLQLQGGAAPGPGSLSPGSGAACGPASADSEAAVPELGPGGPGTRSSGLEGDDDQLGVALSGAESDDMLKA